MIATLRDDDRLERSADVLIIGAGTVGLVTAVTLARSGLSVLCLESGLLHQEAEEHPLNEVVHAKLRYDGAAHGRFRCLGGTSSRWGGTLIPFLAGDIETAGWPISHAEILRFLPEVEALFGLPPGPYSFPGLGGWTSKDFVARLAKWPTFTKRNVATLCRAALTAMPNLEILLDATVTRLEAEDGRVTKVVANSLKGGEVVARGREVIFAAGAIESTRLLLLMDRQNGGRIFSEADQLGRYFSDHLSVPVARLEAFDRTKVNRFAGFQFEPGGTMRNLRFELSDQSELRAAIPPFFAHIAFVSEKENGFSLLRQALQFAQRRRIPPLSLLANMLTAAPWLMRALWWRVVDRRLLYPDDASIELYMVTEQVPSPDHRILLSKDRVDQFGLPLAEISWDVAPVDQDNIVRIMTAFLRAWQDSPLASLARLVPRPEQEVRSDLAVSGGFFHPVGSTRMGKTASDAVVDDQLRPFQLSNATVLSTSVLPNSGGANPTMMLFLLAFRCMERLARKLKS